MKDKIFHRYSAIAVALILLLAIGAKVYSLNSRSQDHDWIYENLQEIDRNQSDYTFIVFGDNKNSKIFDRLVDRINHENASFAVDLGDMVVKGHRAYYDQFLEQAERIDMPFLPVIGNHELYDNGRAEYYSIFGPFYYSFAVGDAYFIMLDDSNEENIDPWQMDWLVSELQHSQNYTYRFVFMHVPLYDPREDVQPGHSMGDLDCARHLNQLFDRYNVSMVFAAHIHAYFNGTWGKTPYIITGGAGGEQIGGDDPAHYFYHYIRFHVGPRGISYDIVHINGPENMGERPLYSLWLHLYVFMDVNALNIVIFFSAFYLGYFLVFIKKKWMTHNFLGEWREKRAEKGKKGKDRPPDKKV